MPLRRHHNINPEREQWDRMERWFVRLCDLQDNGADDRAIVDYALVVLQQCDAMRDWLKEAKKLKASGGPGRGRSVETTPIPESEVDKLFATPELELCRAIVNGAKHLTLDGPHVDKDVVTDAPLPRFVFDGQPIDLGSEFVAAGKRYKVFDFCETCVLRIRGFLVVHGWDAPSNRVVSDVSPNLRSVPDPKGTPWP